MIANNKTDHRNHLPLLRCLPIFLLVLLILSGSPLLAQIKKKPENKNPAPKQKKNPYPIKPPQTITPDSAVNFTSTIGLLGNGTMVLVFERINPLDGRRTLHTMSCKKAWKRPQWWEWTGSKKILKSKKFRNAPVLVPDGDGGLYLFFIAGLRGEKPYLIYRSHTDNGTDWSEPEPLELELEAEVYKHPYAVFLPDKKEFQLVFTANKGTIYSTRSNDGKKWEKPRKVGEGYTPTLAISGKQKIMTYEVKEGDIRTGRFRLYDPDKNDWGKEKRLWNTKHISHPFPTGTPSGFEIYFIKYSEGEKDLGNLYRVTVSEKGKGKKPERMTKWPMNEYRPRVVTVPKKHLHVDPARNKEGPRKPARFLYWTRRTMARDLDIVSSRIPDKDEEDED